MAPSPPVLHTYDPLIAGKVGLYIDAPPASVDLVLWYMTPASGGSHSTASATTIVTAGLDGRGLIVDADSATRYWVAKVHDSTGYSDISNEVSTKASAGPPVQTQVQLLNQALGTTLVAGDVVDVYPATPTTTKKVNADGSIS